MNVLVDHCVPRQVAGLLAGHDARTARQLRCDNLKNGALLAFAAKSGIEAMLTTDKNMRFQQNERTLPFLVLVMLVPRNVLEECARCIPQVLEILKSPGPPRFIDIPSPGA